MLVVGRRWPSCRKSLKINHPYFYFVRNHWRSIIPISTFVRTLIRSGDQWGLLCTGQRQQQEAHRGDRFFPVSFIQCDKRTETPSIWSKIIQKKISYNLSTLGCYKHSYLAPMILNLWNLFSRIRIIMGKFGCAQIRTSRSYSSGKKKDFLMCFLGLEYFAQKFNRPFNKMAKKNYFTLFGPPGRHFWPKKRGF